MSKTITIIVCPACQCERSTDKYIRPGAEMRCPKCRHLFVPVPVPAEDHDLSLPPPPPPGTGPPRTKKEPKELYGNMYQRLGESRRTTGIILGICLAGLIGLWFSWYSDWIHFLGTHPYAAKKAFTKKIDALASDKSLKADIPSVEPRIKVRPESGQPTENAAPTPPPLVTGFARPPAPVTNVEPLPTPPTDFARPLASSPETQGVMGPAQGGLAGAAPGAQKTKKQTPVKPPDPEAEKKAHAKLTQAIKALKDGKSRVASKLKKDVLDLYPDTEAAGIIRGDPPSGP